MSYASASYDDDYNYYDSYDGRMQMQKSRSDNYDRFGSLSGSGYGCYEDEVSIALLVTVAAGLALMWWVLYEKVWQNGGRRKREVDETSGYFEHLSSIFSLGNTDF